LNLKSSIARGAASEVERSEDQAESSERARRLTSEQRKRLKEQLSQLKAELRATEDQAGRPGPLEGRKIKKEIFRLKNELRAAKDRTEGEEPATGALPDFLIIGAQKCGTTSLYHLLTQHPYVEPAAFKELHFFDFDSIFDEGIEWYLQCFPAPKWKDGRRTITGEGTPAFLFYPSVPGRMAKVIPRAQLIALLRNPADRAYSHYQQVAMKGEETRTFEEAIGAGKKTWPLGKEGEASEGADRADLDGDSEYLSRGVYVDQLLRWSEFIQGRADTGAKERGLLRASKGDAEGCPELPRFARLGARSLGDPQERPLRAGDGPGYQAQVGGVLRAAQQKAL
jgi:hypothetical protein